MESIEDLIFSIRQYTHRLRVGLILWFKQVSVSSGLLNGVSSNLFIVRRPSPFPGDFGRLSCLVLVSSNLCCNSIVVFVGMFSFFFILPTNFLPIFQLSPLFFAYVILLIHLVLALLPNFGNQPISSLLISCFGNFLWIEQSFLISSRFPLPAFAIDPTNCWCGPNLFACSNILPTEP